jgi:hypothetical protein
MLINEGDLTQIGTVVLNGAGYGAIRFAPAGTRWQIQNVSVRVSSAINEATATIYKGYIGPQYRVSGSFAGSSGDNDPDTRITLEDGEAMYVEWSGGDAGATATAIVRGVQAVPARGFRVV